MAKVLLINPSYMNSYAGKNRRGVINPIFPTLGLATIAGAARNHGHNVRIFDISMLDYDYESIKNQIYEFQPDIVGITALTPTMGQLIDISILVKSISPSILVVGGGPHPSALPETTLKQSKLDAVFVGEADVSFPELCDGNKFADIKGIYYHDREELFFTGHRSPIDDLDQLAFPAWDLYDPTIYVKHSSRILIRKHPATAIEFSRGCVFKCDYCASKMTMHLGYRKKSPERCADEVRRLFSLGFREFILADDIFTSDEKWAGSVCEAISELGVDVAWTCTNGIRVESADEHLFKKMKRQ